MEPRVVRPKRTLAMSEKILIVDDEPSNRNILGQELTHEGYSVLAASDGREALRKIESSRPDLIILDYMMPDLSGLEVLKELRKRENDTPVVMITAYGTMERAVEAMKEGAYDFITRPFEPDHIALVVREGAGTAQAKARRRDPLGGSRGTLSFDCRRERQDEAGGRSG